MPDKVSCFTVKYDSLSRVLQSPVKISKAFTPDPSKPLSPEDVEHHDYEAVWDTGATGTVLNPKVISECGLLPIGMTRVLHGGGESMVNTFLISLWLPNRVVIHDLLVIQGNINGPDVLIGMDVISQGDLAISNRDNKTAFTYRHPSTECIDFVEEQKSRKFSQRRAPIKANKIGRNDPCPCNSGKKYKNCHGKP